MNWYLEVLKKYTVFDGRARRSEFWYFTLVSTIISLILMIVNRATGTYSDWGGLTETLYSLAVFLPTIGVGIRRMHDTNRSGWWIVLPIVNIVFWAIDSDPGENQYGESPKLIAPAVA